MILVSPSDTFEVSKMSLISETDKEVLLDFYAPIVGAKNVLFYLLLLRLEPLSTKTYSDFFTAYQISQSEFVRGFPSLEAIGLVKTFLRKGEARNHYLYRLYAPKTPAEFFSNELLNALLIRFVDEKEREALKQKYALKTQDLSSFEEVSADFSSYFQLDPSSLPPLEGASEKTLARQTGNLKLYFDVNSFFLALQKDLPEVTRSSLSQEEIVHIARIATLHNLDEEAIASFAARSFEPNELPGHKVNIERLRQIALDNSDLRFAKKDPLLATESNVSGTSSYAKTIRRMDKTGSIQFLSILQKGHKPAKSDLVLIDRLVNDIGLPESVVNALIFFTLSTNDNNLNPNYVEKVGASLVRAGITNALDALNYLGGNSSKRKKMIKPQQPKPETRSLPKETLEKKAETQDDFDDILDSL